MMKRLLLLASALVAVIGCGQNQNGKGYTVVKEFPVEETLEPVRVIQYDPVESNILALFRAMDAGSAMRTTTATTLPTPKGPSRPTSKAGAKASTKLLKPRSPTVSPDRSRLLVYSLTWPVLYLHSLDTGERLAEVCVDYGPDDIASSSYSAGISYNEETVSLYDLSEWLN